MKRESVVKTMAEIAIFSSLGFVLDIVASVYSKAAFVNGGSIGIAMEFQKIHASKQMAVF